MFKLLLLTLLAPLALAEEGIPVKTSLAKLVEKAVISTGVKINIPPNQMTETSVNITTINEVSVCAPESKDNVIALQQAFSKDENLRMTISSYGVYAKSPSGELKFVPADSPAVKDLIGECKNIYVSVW